MNYDEMVSELNRLKFEDLLWLFYGSIIICNIFGNYWEKEYVKAQNRELGKKFNSIFEVILILTFFIYIYLFSRNYNNYQKASYEEKQVYLVRVLGSIFLIMGILCFIYYQDDQRRKFS